MSSKIQKTKSYIGKNKSSSDAKLPLARIIVIFSLIIFLLNCAIIIKREINAYDDSIKSGISDSKRLTHTLSDHIDLTFLAADTTLRRFIDKQYFNALFGKNLLSDMRNNFAAWVDETPQISAMLMTDEKGKIQIIYRKKNYKTWMEGRTTISNEDFFKSHNKSGDNELLYIGWQNSWIKDHEGFIVLSRRLNNLDGTFGGIVLVAVDSDYILQFFNFLETDKKTKMVLTKSSSSNENKNLLVGQVDAKYELPLLKKIIKDRAIYSSSSIISVVEKKNMMDPDFRIFSFNAISNMNLILSVITHGDDIFEGWKEGIKNDMIFLGIFALFVFVLSFFAIAIAKQMVRVQRSEATAIVASQAKSDFLANMSHELRTPLNAIIGFSEMMEAGYFGKLNNKQEERIHDINFCGNHLLELINDILEFSKGEAGKIELREDKVDLTKLIAETVRIFTERSKKSNAKVTCNIREDIPYVLADGRKIRQILLNLISNAVKFTDKNGSVEVDCCFYDNGNIAITVTDNGIGMNEEDIPKALSAFGQVHDDPSHGGTGLGLPLCKIFIELHGGKFIMQSIKGVGTKVSVMLPSHRIIN